MPHARAVEAKERKTAAATAKREAEEKRKEDAKWIDEDKHVNARLNRKTASVVKSEERARRRNENRELAEEEAKQLQSTNTGKSAPKKLTRAEMMLKQLETLKDAKKTEKEQEDLLQPNINHIIRAERFDAVLSGQAEGITASGLEEALSQLEAGGSTVVDKHPERRAKAAYAAYEELWLPRLKEENPRLKRSQLKERIFKQWQSAAENPRNAAN